MFEDYAIKNSTIKAMQVPFSGVLQTRKSHLNLPGTDHIPDEEIFCEGDYIVEHTGGLRRVWNEKTFWENYERIGGETALDTSLIHTIMRND